MNKRFISVLGFALIVSLGATLLFYRLISGRLGEAKQPAPAGVEILVAARNLEVGTLIREADLKSAGWGGPAPQGAITKKEDAVGRGVVSTVYQGEPLMETRLAARGAGAGLAAIIPPGMRAVAVRVNDIAAVAGFAVPGSRVDVLIAGQPPNPDGDLGTLSRTLLQNIEVLSAGQNIQKDAEGKPVVVPVVNLLVTPEQAESLSLASNETRIQLVLRNPVDTKTVATPGTAVAKLFHAQPRVSAAGRGGKTGTVAAPRPKPAPAPQPPAPPITIEILHGGKRTHASFASATQEGRN